VRLHTRPLLWWSSAATVVVVLLKVLGSGTAIKYGEHSITFGGIDSGLALALLGSTLTALVAHGHGSLKDKDGDGKPDP
jgi:hypothetical protein